MTTATLTPLRDLYLMAYRANGSAIECLNLDALLPQDIEAEAAHYERTRDARAGMVKSDGRPADVYGSLRGAKSGGLVRGIDGVAVTMFGTNLERQANAAGGIRMLLQNWGGGKRSGASVVRPATAVRAESKPLDIESELKAIRDREEQLMALLTAKKEAAEASLNALVEEVAEFSELDFDSLKEIIVKAEASDLKSAMRAVKAFSA